ncbi:MAG TPA: hypothetical protein VHP37_25440 [Burkholderiales bacterium]|nr:hypothetical protein [Burkholderiales bacterium]
MQAVEQAVKAGLGRGFTAANAVRPGLEDMIAGVAGADRLVEEARWRLLRAGKGSARAAADLRALKAPLVYAAGKGNAYACEILAAMCASALGTPRAPEQAKEWLIRAVELLEDHVRRPMPGDHGFMLLPSEDPKLAYRPLYTSSGVLITDEIGTARMDGGAMLFDRWGRPELAESVELCSGPTRATPKSVAARIAREATLEDFAWACRRTTPAFREALLDARVIAHGRMGFQRCRVRPAARLAEAA